jgi:hypothetical protein
MGRDLTTPHTPDAQEARAAVVRNVRYSPRHFRSLSWPGAFLFLIQMPPDRDRLHSLAVVTSQY